MLIGKARERELLSRSQSLRALAAYVYAASGPGESTTDLAWDGQATIHELGELLAESPRFAAAPEPIYADVDVGRLAQERMRTGTFNDCAIAAGHPETRFRRIGFDHRPGTRTSAFAARSAASRSSPTIPPGSIRTATRRSTSRSRASPAASRRRAARIW